MGVTFVFPDAADLADDDLSTKPHSELHGDLGDTLEAYIAALGKVTASGWNSLPTLFDPASTVWNDRGWFQFGYIDATSFALVLGAGDNARAGFSTANGLEVFGITSTAYANLSANDSFGAELFMKAMAGQTDPLLDLQDSDGNSLFTFRPIGNASNPRLEIADVDGLVRMVFEASTGFEFFAPTDVGDITIQASDAQATLFIHGATAQTDYLHELYDADFNPIFRVSPTTAGFFGTEAAQSAAGSTAADAIACLKAHGLMAT